MAATVYHHHRHLSVPSVCPIPRTKLFPSPNALSLHRAVLNSRVRSSTVRPPVVEQTGGKMVVELVGAFNELTERMGALSTSSSARLLFKCLKLSIPHLYPLPFAADGRPPLSRAFSVACLLADLQEIVDHISVEGRYKNRFSTMKKLLRDGRKPEEIYDLLGLRVILNPRSGDTLIERGHRACYRTHEVIQTLWDEVPKRTKDYIAKPKANGYRSLHVAVDVSKHGGNRPLMEIQIRTTEMDKLAAGGAASHSLYKGGLTGPEEAKRLKAIMMAAAELAALRLKDMPSTNHRGLTIDHKNRVFRLLDKNGDGRISIEELTEMMEELGAGGEDAQELMRLLDSNSDGSLSTDEFDLFQRQVQFVRNWGDRDDHFRSMLGEKLQMPDSTSLIQVYRKELGDKLAVS